MSDGKKYLTRKKVLMGIEYTVDVPLEQYGGAIVRIHAIPDIEMAQIEQRTNYSMGQAWATITRNFTEADMAILTKNTEKTPSSEPSPEMLPIITKAAEAMTPELALYLGELCRAAILPAPDCVCGGKGCDECNVAGLVNDLKGYSTLTIGLAVMNVCNTSWQDVEDFFSTPKQ